MNRRAIVTFVLCITIGALAGIANAQEACPRPRLITVTGTAEINVAPDVVVFSLEVSSRDRDLTIAKTQSDAHSKKVISAARDSGVEQKDIQTSRISMGPDYSEEKVPRFLAYEVSQSIQITLRDTSKYEALMTKLLEAGITRVLSVSFDLAETRKHRDEARAKAVQAAREKAVAMASELGQKVGKPWEISEVAGGNPFQGLSANIMANRYWQIENSESSVAPGQVTIRASVTVSFLLE